MFCQSLFISCTREGFLHLVPLVIIVVVARQSRALWKVVHLTFGSYFFFFFGENACPFPKTISPVQVVLPAKTSLS